MPQLTLPVFPEESTPINLMLAVEKRDGTVYYFHGLLPVFHHAEDDIQSFRMFISQLIVQGSCKQVEIIRAFGVPPISVKRAVKLFRTKGPAGFFQKKEKVQTPRVLKPDVLKKAQSLLDEGMKPDAVGDSLGIKRDTFYRAMKSGKLVERPIDEKKTKVNGALKTVPQ